MFGKSRGISKVTPFGDRTTISSLLYAKLNEIFSGIVIGSNEHEIFEDGSGNFVVESKSGILHLLGSPVIMKQGGVDRLLVSSLIEVLTDIGVKSGKQQRFYRTDNSTFGHIVANGNDLEFWSTGGLKFYLDDSNGSLRSSNIEPVSSNSRKLGSNTLRWDEAFINSPSFGISVKSNIDYAYVRGDFLVVFEALTANKTATLPASPNDGDTYKIKAGALGGFNLTVDGNGNNFDNTGTDTDVITTDDASKTYSYDGTVWRIS